MSKNPEKTVFRRFLAQNLSFFGKKWPILFFAHLLFFKRRLRCQFELNRSNTANLRSVFLKYCRKTLKKTFFRGFLAKNLIFFNMKWPFLIIAHLFQSKRRLPCKFELNRSDTANMRNVFLK